MVFFHECEQIPGMGHLPPGHVDKNDTLLRLSQPMFTEIIHIIIRQVHRAHNNIGHADARHNPDWPGLVWRDDRLLAERRENKALFLDAARKIFQKLARFADPAIKPASLRKKTRELAADLGKTIGGRDQTNHNKQKRIAKYRELSVQADFGGTALPFYDDDQWIQEALSEKVRGLRDRSDITLARWDPLTDVYSWQDQKKYKTTDWYRFQAAVKDHQQTAWEILSRSNLKGLQLPRM